MSRCLFIATGLSAALPHVGPAHVNPDRAVRNPVHDCVRVDPAAEPGCRSFFLNWVQKTVEAVPYPSSISSSSIDLNLVSGLSSSHHRPHDTHGGHRTASCRHFLLQYFEAGVWRGIWRLWRSRRQHDRWEVINLRALHRTYGCVCWLGGHLPRFVAFKRGEVAWGC